MNKFTIESVCIKNLDSDKEKSLHFSDGINIVYGNANKGKSTFLIQLLWV